MRLRREGLAWRELDGDGVLLDLRSSQYLSTNAVGTMIVGLLQEERTTQDILIAVALEYGMEQDIVASDVHAFLAQLKDKDLIEA